MSGARAHLPAPADSGQHRQCEERKGPAHGRAAVQNLRRAGPLRKDLPEGEGDGGRSGVSQGVLPEGLKSSKPTHFKHMTSLVQVHDVVCNQCKDLAAQRQVDFIE